MTYKNAYISQTKIHHSVVIHNEDIIILSDADEIPNPKIISQIDPENNRYALEIQNFYYYLNGKLFEKKQLNC